MSETIEQNLSLVDQKELFEELHRLSTSVSNFEHLRPEEQEAWETRIASPYEAGNGVPLEKSDVERLYTILESEVLPERDLAYSWKVAHEAFQTLQYVCSKGDLRLAGVAQSLLRRNLPSSLQFVPHENLIVGCLITLLSSGSNQALDVFFETESAAFWDDRWELTTVEEPNDFFRGEAEGALLLLRSKAPLVYSANRPQDAIAYLQGILGRPSENGAYKRFVETLLDSARAKTQGVREDSAIPVCMSGSPEVHFEGPYGDIRPIMTYSSVLTIQPNIEELHKMDLISEDIAKECRVLADFENFKYEDRIESCRRLKRQNLPTELKRWVTAYHVLIAGSLSFFDEMELIAGEWLEQYPNDWLVMPETWREQRDSEVNVNIYLRGYLCYVYAYVFNSSTPWSLQERLDKIRATMEPAFETNESTERDVVLAHIFVAGLLGDVAGKLVLELRRLDPNVGALEDLQSAFRAEQISHLNRAREALQFLEYRPLDIMPTRGTIQNVRQFQRIVEERIRSLQMLPSD